MTTSTVGSVSARDCANAIRALAMDAVQKANSGHPGMPMGMADIAEVLWRRFLKHNPYNPNWPNRDRFILSNGHGSMLQYALLYLAGYDVSLEDLKAFRQLHSKTPGHPEYDLTPGVETTTGPLGQGLANAVGMAIAEAHLSAKFNTSDIKLIDHYTYVFAGDGCLMEGISHEVCSLAGTLKLGKLIVFWDDNGISIDGPVENWFSEDVAKRFKAYNWQVIKDVDGHDSDQIADAIEAGQADESRPTLICCRTQIGFGSPNKANSAGAHGAPLGEDEIALVRDTLNWPHPPFDIPDAIVAAWNSKARGAELESNWNQLWHHYQESHSELAAEFKRRLQGDLPNDYKYSSQQAIENVQAEAKTQATRKASEAALNAFAPGIPELLGGSADLTGSNNTRWSGNTTFNADHYAGDYIYYGVREFGMAAITNGLCLYGSIRPYSGTFLVFSDYMRNAVRMAALMKLPNIFVFTHDSIGLGEDGPTHQPVEHLASLRLIPNVDVWRPADTTETWVAWQQSILKSKGTGPNCLALSRQNLPALQRNAEQLGAIARGGYVLLAHPQPQITLIATGSEVQLVLEAAAQLVEQNIAVSVVSMPCLEVFLRQDVEYQQSVLSQDAALIVAEAGSSTHWYQLGSGRLMHVIGIDTFGESAPATELFKLFDITTDKIIKHALTLVAQK